MPRARPHAHLSTLAAVGLGAAALAAPGLPSAQAAPAPAFARPAASPASTSPGPSLRLVAAQRRLTLETRHGRVYLDPSIWVAARGQPLVFDVRRVPYTSPITITQIIRLPHGGTRRRPLPSSLLEGWNGLRDFATLTARNAAGAVVLTEPVPFCPDSYIPARVSPSSPPTSPYPVQCATVPFAKGNVWGLQRGWAADPLADALVGGPPAVKLPLGVYHVTETVTVIYRRLFHIPAQNASATVTVTLVKGKPGPPPARPRPIAPAMTGRGHAGRRSAPPRPPAAVPRLANPPRSALPNLVALPSWDITVSHDRAGADLLDFGATVWIGGHSRLDVEGFRSHASPTMKAYQYFWRNGRVIGRVRAGTMGFDNAKGHHHWHFQQFARYALLNASKSLVVRSHKQGFCIEPSDEVDLLLPGAPWNTLAWWTRNEGGCGAPGSLWVAEELPVGWGDTYLQTVAGQSFNITNLPNGAYYIEVAANPEHLLRETTTRDDISYRKIILGGVPGARTVKVPAWHGIDPEP